MEIEEGVIRRSRRLKSRLKTFFLADSTFVNNTCFFCYFLSVLSVLICLLFILIIFQYDFAAYSFFIFSFRLGRELIQ